MGTYYQVSYQNDHNTNKHELHAKIEARLKEINEQMSTYMKDSEISRFNRNTKNTPIPVSIDFAWVTNESIKIGNQTGGALDITLGPLVNLWGFGPKGKTTKSPSSSEFTAVQAYTGLDKIKSALLPPTITKSHPSVQIDLSSTAKGHGVDALSSLLSDAGLENHLVDIGGELKARGKKSASLSWTIGIEKPSLDSPGIAHRLELHNIAIATSGDYRNYIERDGVRYSHLIDPVSKSPVRHRLVSATVLHEECLTADGWATALMVLGPEKGFQAANKAGLAALLISKSDGGFVEKSTRNFDKLKLSRGSSTTQGE